MLYVADTHALVGYVVDKLPKKAEIIFQKSEKGEDIIVVPTIVLAEVRYLVKNKKIALNFLDLLSKIETSKNIISVPFDFQVLKLLSDEVSEIHDQIIIATAKFLNAKIITKDSEIRSSGSVECIW